MVANITKNGGKIRIPTISKPTCQGDNHYMHVLKVSAPVLALVVYYAYCTYGISQAVYLLTWCLVHKARVSGAKGKGV